MKLRWLFITLALVGLVFAAVMVAFFGDWVRETIVSPVAYMFWVIGLMVKTLPQGLYWALGILICAVIAVYTLRPRSVQRSEPVRTQFHGVKSRYTQWLAYIGSLEESQFACDSLARELVRLTVHILSYQQDLNDEEIYKLIENKELDVPEDFAAFLHRRSFLYRPAPLPLWKEIIQRLVQRLVPRRFRPRRLSDSPSPIDQEVNAILRNIEALLNPEEHTLEAFVGYHDPTNPSTTAQHANP